ncbi:hypothetical protein [Endozoicomonas sp. ALC066]|uniref:hypothetical protein n=1 Tax=Endozoicomonas sp. ALC066 TaxID=3403078 RepID=UPI003BB761D1
MQHKTFSTKVQHNSTFGRSSLQIAEDKLLDLMEAPRKWGYSRQELQRTGEAGFHSRWREMLWECKELSQLAKDAADLAGQTPDEEWYRAIHKLQNCLFYIRTRYR